MWHSSITQEQRQQIEGVQATCMKVILGQDYQSSGSARGILKLDKLENRRTVLCLKFGLKASTNKKHSKWFKVNPKRNQNLRTKQSRFKIPFCRTERYLKSAIPYLTRSLNQSEK